MAMRAIVDALLNGSDMCRNVFTFDAGPTLKPSDTALATYFDTIWSTTLRSHITNAWHASRVIVEFHNPVSGKWEYHHEFTYDRVGTSITESLPNAVAAVMIGITPSRRRGKKFIAGIPEGESNGNNLGSAFYNVLLTAAANYCTAITEDGNTFDVGVCKPDGTDFLAFNSFRVDQILGTQRRRKPGVGK